MDTEKTRTALTNNDAGYQAIRKSLCSCTFEHKIQTGCARENSEVTKKKGSGHLPSVLDRWQPFSYEMASKSLSPSTAIHVTSLSAHTSHHEYIVWSSSCFHAAVLLVVIVEPTWRIVLRDGGRGLILTGSPFSYSSTIGVPVVDNSGSSTNYCSRL